MLYLCTDHLVYVLESGVHCRSLLLFFLYFCDSFKSDTFKLEEDPVGEVKVVATRLNDQIHKLFHVRVVTLQVEGDQLWDVKLQVLPHWRGQIGVDSALGQLLDGRRLTRVQRDEHGDGIFGTLLQLLLLLLSIWDPLGEALDEVGLARRKFLLFPA